MPPVGTSVPPGIPVIRGWPISSTAPTVAVEEKPALPSLKEAEDEIKGLLDRLSPPMRALLYRVQYREGMRISGAEDLVRKSFKT